MTPLDLKSREEWEAILDGFARDTNMTACLMDEMGNLLFCRVDRFPLCGVIRDNSEATTFICSQTNAAMLAVVKKTLQPEIDACEVGLIRVVVPILRDGSIVGQVAACGLASEDEELNTLLVARQLGMPEERVQELSQSTPSGREEDLRLHAARLFEQLNSG
jgi:ligand-binding sensor protein